ncbi:MAG: ribonuclease P protein component [Gammaproteobacteria bacterium]|nr:ribonuclease P protein component [Gammaproteobacteria bacterium]MCY4165987.1 ribonuclease P protein component [Gammaproteobacteria bacterium]MCY4256363.1 ribonuclease P protein component [Gammaproteobacteria bacterium]MCY4341228.1 ribonuclease P protein component [Gammaproteobacteria bacterium]
MTASARPSPAAGRLEFPRRLRLLKAAQFLAVYQRGQRAAAGPLRVRMIANGREHGRLGLSVGLKAAGSAVARNRIRRQLRESFRRHQHHLAGLDIVVTVPRINAVRKHGVGHALPKLWDAVARAKTSGAARKSR